MSPRPTPRQRCRPGSAPREGTMQKIKFYELGEKIAKLMEEYNIKVYDLEFINELIEKTIERDQKECSH